MGVGVAWSVVETPWDPFGDVFCVSYSATLERWLAGGIDGTIEPTTLLKSDDHGVTWEIVPTPWDFDPGFPSDDLGSILGLARADDIDTWVAVGTNAAGDPASMVSTDGGLTWVDQAQPLDLEIKSCAYLSGVGFVISGTDGASTFALASSPDGFAPWTPRTSALDGENAEVLGSSEDLGMFFANSGGSCSAILYSTDMVTWNTATAPDDPFNCLYNSFAWFDGNLYAGSQYGYFFRTADGITWESVTTPLSQVFVVAATPSVIVAGESSLIVAASTDAVEWNESTTPNYLAVMGYDPVVGRLIAGGGGGFTMMRGVTFGAITRTGRVPTEWKYFIADLSGTGITDLSKLASARSCTPVLNGPLELDGDVPSDDTRVNLSWTDDGYDDPYLAEGTRLMWGFRRESWTTPYYTVRAATLIQLVADSAREDDARTRFTGWDPWHYLFSRPVVNAFGDLPGPEGLSFTDTQASVVIATLLNSSIVNNGHTFIDAGVTYGGTFFWNGTLETDAGMEIDINFPIGTTVGQAWQMVTNMGVCDIILKPIYDPINRANYLVELSVLAQAGSIHDELVFAWNAPGKSLVGLDREITGTDRANKVKFYAGQGGTAPGGRQVPVQTDAYSVGKYGEYWGLQAFPSYTGEGAAVAVEALAAQQLALRALGKETVTFIPAPERSPRPWQDYNLGDRVPVWATQQKFRATLGEQFAIISASNGSSYFRVEKDVTQFFDPGDIITVAGTTANDDVYEVVAATFGAGVTTITVTVAPANQANEGNIYLPAYQRIYGWRASISDDALETIDPVLVSINDGVNA